MFEFLLVIWAGLLVTVLWILKFVGSIVAILAGMLIVGYPTGALVRYFIPWENDYNKDGSIDWIDTVGRQMMVGLVTVVIILIIGAIVYSNGCNVIASCAIP